MYLHLYLDRFRVSDLSLTHTSNTDVIMTHVNKTYDDEDNF